MLSECAPTWHPEIIISFTGAWPRAMGFLGAVAGSAAGAILSSTRRSTRPSEHAVWMAFGAAMGIEGMMQPAFSLFSCGSSFVPALQAREERDLHDIPP